MPGLEQLSLVLFSGGFERVHYGLVMASTAAATNRATTLFFTGRALLALAAAGPQPATPGWHGLDAADDGSPPAARDAFFAARGIATFEELLGACAVLGVRFLACEMGLRALALEAAGLRSDLPVAIVGVATLLAETPPGGALVFL